LAGLEININLFRKAQTRSIIFGVITTIVPQVLGTVYGLAFAMRLFLASSSARYSHRTF